MARKAKPPTARTVETLRHRREEATRKNIPTDRGVPVGAGEADAGSRARRLRAPQPRPGPQFVWRGKDEQDWSNRMILGNSLQVVASLAEREGLRGKVQCIYIDPPYGFKFNSDFQWSTISRDVKDGNAVRVDLRADRRSERAS